MLKDFSKSFLQTRLILVSFGAGLIINIILWMILAGKFGLSRELVPLHFNVVYGIDFVSTSRNVYQLPAAGLVILLVNFAISKALFGKEKLFSYFLGVASATAQIILLVAILSLLILNK